MSKKILSVVLAIALVASCFAVSAFALGGLGFEELDENGVTLEGYTQSWELGVPVDNGDGTWSVDVTLDANYTVGPIQFKVTNTDNANVVLDGFTANGDVVPENWMVDEVYSNETGIVALIPQPEVDAVDAIDCTGGVVIGTLTYTVAGTASATIAIDPDRKTATNPGGSLIAARMSDGNVVTGTAIVGQDVLSVGPDRVIGAAPSTPPTLQVIDGTNGVIDTSRTNLDEEFEGTTCDGYLYGVSPIDDGETIDGVFEVIGDGTMNIIDSPLEFGTDCGTGTMVQVLDLDGAVVAEYVLIVFGDVNGDGEATVDDASDIELHDGYMYGDNGRMVSYQIFAADLNMDEEATIDDAADVELHDGYMYGDTGRLPSNIYA